MKHTTRARIRECPERFKPRRFRLRRGAKVLNRWRLAAKSFECAGGAVGAREQPGDRGLFGSPPGQQVNCMDAARLADALDAAYALFETEWSPWQLEVDHQAATVLKVEPLAGGVSGEEEPCGATGEGSKVLAPSRCGEPSVQRHWREVP